MNPRIIVFLGLCALPLGACREARSSSQTTTSVASQQDTVMVQASDTTLVGKRIHLSFEGNTSVVEYLSHQHLYWFSKDSVHGEKEGRDNYSALHIEPHVFFVNWVERDGTTISQVLDLKARTCQAFITSNVYSAQKNTRSTVTLSGKITCIEDSMHLLFE